MTDISSNLSRLHLLLPNKRDKISKLGRELSEAVLDKIKLFPKESENVQVTGLRDSLLWSAYKFRSEKIAQHARNKLKDLLNGKTIHSDIISR